MTVTLEQVPALIAAVLAEPARRDELVALLDEQSPLQRQLPLADAEQVRGFVLAAFERVGLPPAALSFALEELESGHHAYAIAGAARALRGASPVPAGLEPYLQRALWNLSGRDELVSFETFPPAEDAPGAVTASEEVRATQALLRAAEVGGCCDLPALAWGKAWVGSAERARSRALRVVLEDHAGQRSSLGARLAGRPALLTFFYTRCENPQKCSLTISKLAAFQARLAREGLAGRIRLAAISYDPGFDSAVRLRRYGEQRGLRLGPDALLLRPCFGLQQLQRAFQLGVSFLGAAVARHRIELFLLDARGRVAASFTRLSWQEDEVLARCRQLVAEPAPRPLPSWLALPAPVLLVLLPKCPLCWAAYVSALGVASAQSLPYPAFAAPLLFGLVTVGVLLAAVRARRSGYYLPLALSVGGAALLAPLVLGGGAPWLALGGVLLTFAGAALGARRVRGTLAPPALSQLR